MCAKRRAWAPATAVLIGALQTFAPVTSSLGDAGSQPSAPAKSASVCRDVARLHALDFWIGHWDVSWSGQHVGTNVVATILGDCAITERWRDVEGGEGFSLFYYDVTQQRWKQVWVTDSPFRTGGTKEKAEQTELTGENQIRFLGRYPGADGALPITDRTTLTKRDDGTVRQLIEVSLDGGKTWQTRFDGIYRRSARP